MYYSLCRLKERFYKGKIFILQFKYRDRAKERREKYGTPAAIIPGWKRRLEREMAKDPPIPLVNIS